MLFPNEIDYGNRKKFDIIHMRNSHEFKNEENK